MGETMGELRKGKVCGAWVFEREIFIFRSKPRQPLFSTEFDLGFTLNHTPKINHLSNIRQSLLLAEL